MGEDAIWLQDKNSVLGFGHTGLLIQDDRGRWYHFYWGNTGRGLLGKLRASGILTPLYDFSYTDLENLNDKLNGKLSDKDSIIYSGRYEDAIYIKGDFTASVKYANRLTRNYNLIKNNCMQLSAEVLLKGRFKENHTLYKSVLRNIRYMPIPNCAYLLLRYNNAITRWREGVLGIV